MKMDQAINALRPGHGDWPGLDAKQAPLANEADRIDAEPRPADSASDVLLLQIISLRLRSALVASPEIRDAPLDELTP